MTIEVEVNGQLYTGASVVKADCPRKRAAHETVGVSVTIWGDGGGRVRGNRRVAGTRLLISALAAARRRMPQYLSRSIAEERLERFALLSKSRFKTEISRSHYPLLVAFMDINDPNSVREVDPG
ncbi:MAG: hypothetical protein R3B83_06015 [Nitrospirales bacterium]|nr:hypothetical protein [Nitrospirales bacterium]